MADSSPKVHNDLPPSSSQTLLLTQPTSAEATEILKLNGASWRGALSLPAYVRREAHLANQAFTRDGGLTSWILVEGSAPHDPQTPRRILSSCETLRKRALVATSEGRVEEVVCHGVGSVFCADELRGRGYAGRMMKELGKKLERWQQNAGVKSCFTVLYSDIGKVGGSRERSVVVDVMRSSRYRSRSSMRRMGGIRSLPVMFRCRQQEVPTRQTGKPHFLRPGQLKHQISRNCAMLMSSFSVNRFRYQHPAKRLEWR